MVDISRDRLDPSQLDDNLLLHYSIPVLDETDEPISEPASTIGSHKFRVGSDAILVSLLNPRIPRVWRARGGPATVCSTEFAVLRPTKQARLTLEFLHLLCRSPVFWEQLQLRAVGTTGSRQRAKTEGLLSIEVNLPSLPEQQRIVDLIGALDAQIEALGAEMVVGKALYATLRRSLLTYAPDLTRPLGDVAEVRLGRMLSKERASGEEQAPYVRNANVQWAGLGLADLKRMSFPARERQTYELLAGDILVCEGGDPGRAVLLEADLPGVYYQKAIHRVRAHSVEPGFLYEWLAEQYSSGAIADLCTNTTIAHLTAEKFRTLRVAVPSEVEQQRITSSLLVARRCVVASTAEGKALRQLRVTLLSNLLAGTVEIPDSYDSLLEAV